ncbi:MAG TPA: adenylate/guanylate cyclase domain-containing protein [Actinomycetota bacterium]
MRGRLEANHTDVIFSHRAALSSFEGPPYATGMPACPNCGTENPPQARFCMNCAVGLAGPTAPREVRKTVTVVFSDVSGSTTLGERIDPESLRRVMGRFFDEMHRVLSRHGGTVEKFIGDAVMAVFGIPVLHEDDALRAVRAAWEMRDALTRLNQELERDWGVTLAARTGVNTGEVVAGDPAAGQRLVTGDAVNVAARLEQAARSGEILLGEQTHRLVRDAVDAEPIAPLPLKGKSAPVAAYRLLEIRPGAEAHERRLDSPMVGRDGQVAMLIQAFRASVSNRACHLFTVLGSAGVGKSRLVLEFLHTVSGEAQVLRGRCLSYGEGITFWPVAEVVKATAGITEQSTPDDIRAGLVAILGVVPDSGALADRLTELLGVGDSVASPEEAFWAVRRLLEALAARRPLVVVFDDIHWAEPTFLDLIEHVADWTKDSPLLLVCSARPDLLDHRPGWGGGKFNATSILLEPLGAEDSERLIDNLVGAAELPTQVKRRIVEAAEGTPLFVEEMLSMLIDDGLLRRDDGHWIPAGDLATVDVPPTIHALLAARLDRLQQEERAVVECGSVEGKVFHRGALAELAPEGARSNLRSHLLTLTRRELIRPERADLAGEEAFRFRHQLIRDAAYQGMPKERRAELHERFAAWLEGSAGTLASEYEEIVGYHLEQTYRYRAELGPTDEEDLEVARRAALHLATAGRRAHGRGDLPAAVNLLERGRGLLPLGDRERMEMALPLSDALFDLGEFERCEALVAEAIDEADRSGERRLQMHLQVVQIRMRSQWNPEGFVQEAEEVGRGAIAMFEEAGDDLGLARAWSLLAARLHMLGHAEGVEEAIERVAEYARRAGDRVMERQALQRLAGALFWGPTPVEQGSRRLERMLRDVEGDRMNEARIKRSLAGFLAMQGRFDEGRRLLAECRATFEELGVRFAVLNQSFFTGTLELLAGDSAAAEAALRESCEALQAMGDRSSLCSLAAFLAEALYLQGNDEEAWHFTRVADQAAGEEDLEAQWGWRSVRAKILARRGQWAEAEALVQEAVRFIERTGEIDHKGDAHRDLAEVLRLAGKDSEAADALKRAIEWYEAKGNVVSVSKARAQLEHLDTTAAD